MVDIISEKKAVPAIKFARLKVSTSAAAQYSPGMTQAEKQLSDIVSISADATKRAEKTRRLDGYLRLLNSVWKFMNGATKTYQPIYSKVDIEYFTLEKTDQSV